MSLSFNLQMDDLAPPPPLLITQNVICEALNQQKTFRTDLYRKIKIFGCVAFGIGALAVIKSRFR